MYKKIIILFNIFCITFITVTANAQALANRTITFKNNCPFPVWPGMAGGSVSPTPCTDDSSCPLGSACIQIGGGGGPAPRPAAIGPGPKPPEEPVKLCFWKNPIPANNKYKLKPGESSVVTIPQYKENTVWSGVIVGRTLCDANGVCETADCGSLACQPARGFQPPATQAEFTLDSTHNDFYDLTVINGINIPISVTALPATNSQLAPAPNNPAYWCGNPGSLTPRAANAAAGLKGCPWKFTVPAPEYVWVSATRQGSTCNGLTNRLEKKCGKFLGYWTANQVCGMSAANPYGAPFNCAQPLPTPQRGTLTNLYQCSPQGSCYQDGATSECCGCTNWTINGIKLPTEKLCVAQNPTWLSDVLPGLSFLKKACPSAYTYPYDDMTSTFQCRTKNSINLVNYKITYCPGGKTGRN